MISRLSPRKGLHWVVFFLMSDCSWKFTSSSQLIRWKIKTWLTSFPETSNSFSLLISFRWFLLFCPDCLTPLLLFWFYKTQWKCALFLPKSTSDKPWLWFCLLYLLHFVYFLMLLGVRKEGFENYLINEPEFNGREMGQWLISGHYIIGETSTVIGTEVYSDNRW